MSINPVRDHVENKSADPLHQGQWQQLPSPAQVVHHHYYSGQQPPQHFHYYQPVQLVVVQTLVPFVDANGMLAYTIMPMMIQPPMSEPEMVPPQHLQQPIVPTVPKSPAQKREEVQLSNEKRVSQIQFDAETDVAEGFYSVEKDQDSASMKRLFGYNSREPIEADESRLTPILMEKEIVQGFHSNDVRTEPENDISQSRLFKIMAEYELGLVPKFLI